MSCSALQTTDFLKQTYHTPKEKKLPTYHLQCSFQWLSQQHVNGVRGAQFCVLYCL